MSRPKGSKNKRPKAKTGSGFRLMEDFDIEHAHVVKWDGVPREENKSKTRIKMEAVLTGRLAALLSTQCRALLFDEDSRSRLGYKKVQLDVPPLENVRIRIAEEDAAVDVQTDRLASWIVARRNGVTLIEFWISCSGRSEIQQWAGFLQSAEEGEFKIRMSPIQLPLQPDARPQPGAPAQTTAVQ